LKKDTARFTSPETPEGKKYWDSLYRKAGELFGTSTVNIPTLVRPWIVPGEVVISSTPTDVYVYKANLKVMLEEDCLKGSGEYSFKDERLKELNEYSAGLIRKLILPKLTEDVNNARRYAGLRQVYYSLILAQWFKEYFRGDFPSYQSRINQKDISGLVSDKPSPVEDYFNAYRKSFKEGEYDIKEQVVSAVYGQSIRQYRSGGLQFADILTGNQQARIIFGNRPDSPPLGSYAVQAKIRPTEGDVLLQPTEPAASPEENEALKPDAPYTEGPQMLLEQSRKAYAELDARAEKHLSDLADGRADAVDSSLSGREWIIYRSLKDYHSWLKEYLRLYSSRVPSPGARARAMRDIIGKNLQSELQAF
jgi:hypothetical protein